MTGLHAARRVDGVLLDIEGVLVTGSVPVPGASGAVAWLRELGLPVRFITNTTSAGASRISATLAHTGIEVRPGELFTAAGVTASYLQEHHPDARCLLLNDGGNDELAGMRMADPDDTTADVVVIGGGGPAFGWRQLNVALNCLLDGASLVAMHGAPLWRTAEGFCLDAGAYVRMLEAASGVTAVIVGKPSPYMFTAAAESTGVAPERLAMVGDDLVNDVLAAQDIGMLGTLVRTGKFRQRELDNSERRPDLVIDSVTELPSILDGGRVDLTTSSDRIGKGRLRPAVGSTATPSNGA